MGRRSILNPFQVFTGVDSTSNPISTITDITGLDNITHVITVDGTVNGEMFVEFSKDQGPTPQTFYPLSFGESLTIAGASEVAYMTKIQNHGFKWMRLRFANSGGSGSIDAWISGNTVGG